MGRFTEHAMEADSISMAYAEFNIGINDEEYEDPRNPSIVDTKTLMLDYLEPRMRRGDMRLAVSITPIHWYEAGYTGNSNSERRGIHVLCRLGDCEWHGNGVDHERYFKLWRGEILEFVKGLMTHLRQNEAKIYFRGVNEEIVILESTWY